MSLKFLPKHPADVPATCADIEKAERLLGWEPEVRIEEGIRRAVEWYLKNVEWLKKVKI